MCQNQYKMLMYITKVTFALDDVILFLDTHPCDKEALSYYQMVRKEREKAMKQYNEQYGPLQIDQVESCDYWTWLDEPWPWELQK